MSSTQTFRNLAFISYSRKADSLLASRLQADLERYSIPTGLTCPRDILVNRRYIRPVFRDHTDLDVRNDSFWDQIEKELSCSRTLILMCSPTAAKSVNVDKEVRSFLATHDHDLGKVLPIIVSGNISDDTGSMQCLPEVLRPYRAEILSRNLPLASDCSRLELTLKVASWILGVEYNALYQQHRNRQTRKRVIVTMIAVIVLSVIGVLSWKTVEKSRLAEARRIANLNLDQERLRQETIAGEERITAENRAYVGKIRLAIRSIDQGRLDTAIQALNECDPKMRDWEWGFLWGETDQSLTRFITNHGDRPVAPSLDGTSLAVCGPDQSIRIIAVDGYKEMLKIDTKMERVNVIAWSDDSQSIAAGSMNEEDGELAVWDVSSGEQRFSIEEGAVSQVSFSPDDTEVFASLPHAGAILHCNASTGESIGRPMVTAGNPAGRFIVSADGSRVAALDYDGRKAFYFHAKSGEMLWSLSIADIYDKAEFKDLDISPDGKRVLLGTDGAGAWLIDANTGEKVEEFVEGRARTTCVSFGPNGNMFAVGLHGGTVDLYNYFPDSLVVRLRFSYQAHSTPVTSLAVTTAEKYVLSSSDSGEINATFTGFENSGSRFRGHLKPILGLAPVRDVDGLASGSAKFVTWSEDLTARVWSLSHAVSMTLPRRTKHVPIDDMRRGIFPSTNFRSPNGVFTVRKSMKTFCGQAELVSGDGKSKVDLNHEEVSCVAFDSRSEYLLTGSLNHTGKIWRTKDGQLISDLIGHSDSVVSGCFTTDGQHVLTGGNDGTLRIWNRDTGEIESVLQGHSKPVKKLAFNADPQRIASTDDSGTLILWDATTRKPICTLKAHSAAIVSLAFSSDGRNLLSASHDQSIKIWSSESGTPIQSLSFPAGFEDAAMNPSGSRLIVLSIDGTLGIWDLKRGEHILDLPLGFNQAMSARFSSDGHTIEVTGVGVGPTLLKATVDTERAPGMSQH